MDKNAYAKGWWDAMAKKRDPQGVTYTWSEPPAIPVSEISRILVNTRKNVLNLCKQGKWNHIDKEICEKIIDILRDALELRRRSRVSTHNGSHGQMVRSTA